MDDGSAKDNAEQFGKQWGVMGWIFVGYGKINSSLRAPGHGESEGLRSRNPRRQKGACRATIEELCTKFETLL